MKEHNQPYSYNSGAGLGPLAVGYFLGLASAVAVSGYILFGPHGRQNRKKVDQWAHMAKNEILDKMQDVEDMTKEQYHKIVDKVITKHAKLSAVGKEKAQKIASDFKDKFDEMKDAVQEAIDSEDDEE